MANDDLDDLLRHAMKTLDDQVPPGYFEGLPSRTLARLEDSSMQTSSSGTSGTDTATSGPIAIATGGDDEGTAQDRDEDSGLHDIRNLASSARMRMSSRRISTSPPQDEDLLASSSGGWKAVALPEPAKMVSLPEISPTDLKKAEKADRKSRKSGEMKVEAPARTSSPALAPTMAAASSSMSSMPAVGPVADAPLHLDDEPAKPAVASVTPIIGARIAAQNQSKRGRNALLGTIGVGLAAAAGVMIYMQVANKSEDAPASRGQANEAAAPAAAIEKKPEPTVQSIASDNDGKVKDTAAAGSAAAVEPVDAKADKKDEPPPPPVEDPAPVAVPDKLPPVKGKKPVKTAPGKPVGKKVIEVDMPEPAKKPTKAEVKPTDKPTKGGKEEPDFNDLLKEAGVDQNKPAPKPKLDKTSLSGSDFKAGMAAISGRAAGCYKGEQGNANVKLVVAPSGQVSRATVTGQFAGTPVAACVEAAVRGATFPPWDGGPQTFNYSFLLQEK